MGSIGNCFAQDIHFIDEENQNVPKKKKVTGMQKKSCKRLDKAYKLFGKKEERFHENIVSWVEHVCVSTLIQKKKIFSRLVLQ